RIAQHRDPPHERIAVVEHELRPYVAGASLQRGKHVGPEVVDLLLRGAQLSPERGVAIEEVERRYSGWLERTEQYLAAQRIGRPLRRGDEGSQGEFDAGVDPVESGGDVARV